MVDGFPSIDDTIRDWVREDWRDGRPQSAAALEQFVRDLRGIIVASPAESDCRSVSEGLGVALDELDVSHTVVTDGLCDNGDDIVPHAWVVIHSPQKMIVDGTAEQFNNPRLGDVGLVTPDEDVWDKYIQ